jgi:hypothetical protein
VLPQQSDSKREQPHGMFGQRGRGLSSIEAIRQLFQLLLE